MSNRIIVGLFSLALAFSLGSCERSNGAIGSDKFDDDRAVLGEKLTFPLVMYTEKMDSVSTKSPSQVVLGNLLDPVFGRTEAAFSTRIILSKVDPDFAPETVVDSVKLRIAYSGTYGLTGGTMQLQVFPLLDPFVDTLSYYSNYVPAIGPALADTNLLFDPSVKIFNGVDSLTGFLACDLDPAYFQQWIVDAAINGETYLSDNDDFVQQVPGLHFRDGGAGMQGAGYFDLDASASLIQLYYHVGATDTVPKVFSLTFGQNFGDPVASVNHYSHDHSTAEFDLTNQDSAAGEARTYAQSGGGVRTVIEIPGLDTLIGKGYSINRADLKVYAVQGTSSPWAMPGTLLALMDVDTASILVKDYTSTGSTTTGTGGTVAQLDVREYAYNFNFTRTVHDFINDRERVHRLFLIPSGSGASMSRLVLAGGMNSYVPAEFNVYYTKSE